eukprot:7383442-Prymnesium_polylepis.5
MELAYASTRVTIKVTFSERGGPPPASAPTLPPGFEVRRDGLVALLGAILTASLGQGGDAADDSFLSEVWRHGA